MPQTYDDLEDLLQLARESSCENRELLLKRITEIFLSAPAGFTPKETSHFGAVMETLAVTLEQRVREELAGRLAAHEVAPPDLIRRLAEDVIAVARPILEKSPVLDRRTLVAIAEHRDQDYLRAIAGREHVDEELSAVIARRGEDAVVAHLVRNPGARLSRPTMRHVVGRARAAEELHEPLAMRDNIPTDIIADLFAFVSDELQRRILANRSEQDRSELLAILARMKGSLNRGGPSQSELNIDRIAADGQLNEARLLQLLSQGALPEFMIGLARLACVDPQVVQRALSDQSGKGLVILCKAGKLQRETFRRVVVSSRLFHKRTAAEIARVATVYDRMDEDDAVKVLRLWQARLLGADTDTAHGTAGG